MHVMLLLVIYVTFISLGLPDSLLGVSWPLVYKEFGVQYAAAGILSIMITICTTIAALVSGYLNRILATQRLVLFSVIITAIALLGFASSQTLLFASIMAVPLGLGGGSIDAALNNYVASHYKAHHMSWLHAFWGLGATLGPLIMSYSINSMHGGWRTGYTWISLIQFGIVIILLTSYPLWKRMDHIKNSNVANASLTPRANVSLLNFSQVFKLRGALYAMIVFLFYCGIESSVGLWGASFLIEIKGLSPAVSALWISLYYSGITIGRILSGFISMKLKNIQMIRLGQFITLIGIALVLLPLPSYFSLFGLLTIGFGLAPIFPCMIHETPVRFGIMNSQQVIGYQMAAAYTGVTILPPIVGFISSYTSMLFVPFALLLFALLMILSSENVNKLIMVNEIVIKSKI